MRLLTCAACDVCIDSNEAGDHWIADPEGNTAYGSLRRARRSRAVGRAGRRSERGALVRLLVPVCMMSHAVDAQAEEFSSLGDDPDLAEVVQDFVDEMPERVAVFENAFASGDLEALRRAAHQLKGAAGSYGFDQLTPYAASVEELVRDSASDEAIRASLDELSGVCQRLRGGAPRS